LRPSIQPSLLQSLQQSVAGGACLWITFGQIREQADASHPLGLLRLRRKRPSRRRTAEQRDEFAAL
jgi:hypothetical protein